MTGCTVKELCAAVGGTLLRESGAVVTQVSTDSRSIPAGALFVPLVGERFDGHAYIAKALDEAAKANPWAFGDGQPGYPDVRDGGDPHHTPTGSTSEQFADWFAQVTK